MGINIMLILMKHKDPKTSEIMLVEHSLECSQTIGDLIKQVPQKATNPVLRAQTYKDV